MAIKSEIIAFSISGITQLVFLSFVVELGCSFDLDALITKEDDRRNDTDAAIGSYTREDGGTSATGDLDGSEGNGGTSSTKSDSGAETLGPDSATPDSTINVPIDARPPYYTGGIQEFGGIGGASGSGGIGGSDGSGGTRGTGGAGGTGGTSGSGGDGGTGGTSGTGGYTTGDPAIPQVPAECPSFRTGNFNFQGLTGIMEVGAKGSGDGSLLFYWHGSGMPASSYTSIGANVQRITSQGGIIVSPDGPVAGEAGAVCSGTMLFGDTVTWEVVDQIVACAVRDHNINPRRIYSTGCSSGGLQTGCMAARRSSYVAAVATNSGGVVLPLPYQPESAIPAVFAMHGGEGDTVVINFGNASRELATMTKDAGGFAVECNHGDLHCGAPTDLYSAAFDFLLAHPYGVDPKPYASGLPANVPSYCAIY